MKTIYFLITYFFINMITSCGNEPKSHQTTNHKTEHEFNKIHQDQRYSGKVSLSFSTKEDQSEEKNCKIKEPLKISSIDPWKSQEEEEKKEEEEEEEEESSQFFCSDASSFPTDLQQRIRQNKRRSCCGCNHGFEKSFSPRRKACWKKLEEHSSNP